MSKNGANESLGEDSSGLGPMGAGPISIGSVDEVNGRGAVEVPDYVPTRAELTVLLQHWVDELINIRLDCWLWGESGSTAIRIIGFAHRRIDRLGEALGDDAVAAAFTAKHEKLKSELGEIGTAYINGQEPPDVYELMRNGVHGLPVDKNSISTDSAS